MRETHPNAWLDQPPVSLPEAEEYLLRNAFRSGPDRKVGVELEWLVHDPRRPRYQPGLRRIRRILDDVQQPMLGGSVTAIEPGGQVELVSAAATNLQTCLDSVSLDLAELRAHFRHENLRLTGIGLDPLRLGKFVLTQTPRYNALFHLSPPQDSALGHPAINTASIQVNVDCGDDTDDWRGYRERWQLLHAIGPVLTSIFANSPFRNPGVPTGSLSTRQLCRFNHFTERTSPPSLTGDHQRNWAQHMLDSAVLFFRMFKEPWLTPDTPTSMREWLAYGGPRPATLDDLDYHLTTMYPPIRARGYYELRMIDALPADYWVVPPILVNTLLDDELAHEAALAAVQNLYTDMDLMTMWRHAAHHGPADPRLAQAAIDLFLAASAALDRMGIAPRYQRVFREYADQYVARGRCPAHDLLETGPQHVLADDVHGHLDTLGLGEGIAGPPAPAV